MRITTMNTLNNKAYSNVRFGGLWGDTIKRKEQVSDKQKLEIYNYEIKEYYPFAEESLQAVHDIMKENTTFKITRQEEGLDKFLYCKKFEGTDVRVKPSLLFTTKQWINYITNKLVSGSVECNFIEQNLKNLHLERYLRA